MKRKVRLWLSEDLAEGRDDMLQLRRFRGAKREMNWERAPREQAMQEGWL